MNKGAVHRLSARILVSALVLAGAACSLVAGLDKLQFTDACLDPCDDENPCTAGDCRVDGACQGQPSPDGTACTIDGGIVGACVGAQCAESCSARACDDTNPCTSDTCVQATETCLHTPVPDGTLAPGVYQAPGDCHTWTCLGGKSVDRVDDSDRPDPWNTCIDSRCTNGQPSIAALPGGTKCGDGGTQKCNDAGMCGCTSDSECPPLETCGGGGVFDYCGCTPTTCDAGGLTCGTLGDGCGGFIHCDDDPSAPPNGSETDKNCGGPLPSAGGTCAQRCGVGAQCDAGSDCTQDASVPLYCTAGVCCTGASCTVCRSCDVAGHEGSCWPQPVNTKCRPGHVCDGQGHCLLPVGATCNNSADCFHYCLNGKCH